MPLWGTGYPGYNPISGLNFTDLRPGDNLFLLDGTETVITGSSSIAFIRGNSWSQDDAGTSFQITGCPNNSVITFYASNGVPPASLTGVAVTDLATYLASFNALPGGAITGNGAYTDIGRSLYYLCKVSTFVSGDKPVVIAQR